MLDIKSLKKAFKKVEVHYEIVFCNTDSYKFLSPDGTLSIYLNEAERFESKKKALEIAEELSELLLSSSYMGYLKVLEFVKKNNKEGYKLNVVFNAKI